MDLDKFKRDYKYKSTEGASGSSINTWIIIVGGALVVLLAYLMS